jgi:hypothetical protein
VRALRVAAQRLVAAPVAQRLVAAPVAQRLVAAPVELEPPSR